MRAEPAARRAFALALTGLGGGCVAAGVATAGGIPVNLDVQYQRIESAGETREFWTRSLDLTHSTRLSPALQLSTQFRLAALDYIGRPEKSLAPYGSIQLSHRVAGLTASYRPSRTTNGAAITTRQQDAQLAFHVAPEGLPRIDAQWTRRHQEATSLVPAGTGITRNGRLSWTRGDFELRGGAGDVVLQTLDANRRETSQRSWDVGFGWRAGRASWTLHLDADLAEVRRGATAGAAGDRNRTRGGLLEYSRRISRVMDASTSYQMRAIEAGRGAGARRDVVHDGAATWNLRPTRATHVLVAGGVRPVTLQSGAARTLGYVMASATAQGRVRAGWTGIATVAQTLNRNPGGHAYRVGTYRAGSRLVLTRGLEIDLDATVTSNGDTAAHDARTTTIARVGLTATPLRRITLGWSLRGHRAGPDLGHAAASAATQTFDLRWQPARAVDLTANLSRSGALPHGSPTLTTRRYSIRVSPTARLQADVQYARGSQARQDTGGGRLVGREVWSARALAGLGRRFRVSAGGSLSDPGQATRSRQADVTLSLRVGGGS